MSRLSYFFSFIFLSFFSTLFFDTSLRDYRIKRYGEEKNCVVLTSGECGKSGGTIKVLMQTREYKLSIGRVDCIENKYRIGTTVKVLYGYDYDYIILPEEKAELGLYMSVLFFILPLYCLYQLIISFRKSVFNNKTIKKRKI